MKGTILILDGVATNRIMLKVLLSSAFYHVVQADRTAGLTGVIRRTAPDLIVTAHTLPDGTLRDVMAATRACEADAPIPVIAVSGENDRAARLRALSDGADDVLCQPLDDRLLQARIRGLIRARDATGDLGLRNGTRSALGFSEAGAVFALPSRIAILARDAGTATLWRAALGTRMRHRLTAHRRDDLRALSAGRTPDAIPDALVVQVDADGDGLRTLSELRAQTATRHAAIIALVPPGAADAAADALDLGADDVMPTGFCADELALRLTAQLRRKARADSLRRDVQTGLQAALRDPMTGLYNRRYALPRLTRIMDEARQAGRGLAVMLADLDHFKQINDLHGHPAGDAVLTEAAQRLQGRLRRGDLIARLGGEEFLIALPETELPEARALADELRRCIGDRGFDTAAGSGPVRVTLSIGVVALTGAEAPARAEALIAAADRALYRAKGAGRDRVALTRAAA